jgi:glycosyltransferase involved in cell wall biosynthesis
MKVSAVIVTYNRREFIRRAIDSILHQTVPVDEIVVVDDGSTDGTAGAVAEWFGSVAKVVRQENGGVGAARWRGVREASGDWIAFLDSDDEWLPDRTRLLREAAAKVPADVAWIFGDMQVVTDVGSATTLFGEHGLTVRESPEIFPDPLSVQFPFQFGLLQGSFIRREVLLELECFGERLRSDDDLLAGFQVACRYRFAAIPDIVGKYFRTSDLSASSVVTNGVYGVDHFRSRMLAFELVVQSGRRTPWNMRYASEVRGLCKVLATRGAVPKGLALQQFRYGGYSVKGVGFLLAAMMGRRGILAWEAVGEFRRQRRRQ